MVLDHELKPNQFYFDNITGSIQGATVQEGDFIKSVRFTISHCAFFDGWRVERKGGNLGIYWGYAKEFTPFKHFAWQCVFEKEA